MAMTTFAVGEPVDVTDSPFGCVPAPHFDPLTETGARRPPWPPSDLADVLFDEFGTGNELIVTVGPDGVLIVHLNTKALRARGAAIATGQQTRNGSVVTIADVPVVGYDIGAEHRVRGRISIAITYQLTHHGQLRQVAGTAYARGDWACGPLRFRVSNSSHDSMSDPSGEINYGALLVVPAAVPAGAPTGTDPAMGDPQRRPVSGSGLRRLTRVWRGR